MMSALALLDLQLAGKILPGSISALHWFIPPHFCGAQAYGSTYYVTVPVEINGAHVQTLRHLIYLPVKN